MARKYSKPHKYTIEESKWLTDNIKGVPRKELWQRFNERFGLSLSFSAFANRLNKLGLHNGLTGGQFKKGSVPFNKGRKQVEYMTPEMIERTAKTRFKKGGTPPNVKQVGAERYDKDGYVLVKVANCKRWKLKHRIIYEQAHNIKLTRDDIIIFADGNPLNFDVDNLVKITNNELARLNYNHLYYKGNKEATKVGVDIVRLKEKIRKIERG